MSPLPEGWFGTPAVLASVVAGIAAVLRVVSLWRARRDRLRLADARLLRRMTGFRHARGGLRVLLVAGGAAGLVLSLGAGTDAAPRPATGEGPETVLVLDASNSMLAEDVEPSRLHRQRVLAAELVERLAGHVGVVYFAGAGYMLSPLTTDLTAVRMFVEAVRPASVGRGGSALAAGLEEALDVLAGGREGARRSIVLLSDGEETAGAPMEEAIRRARREGVAIYTLGIGTREGSRIPLGREAAVGPLDLLGRPPGGTGYLRGPDGTEVVTRLERATLERIARETGGVYRSGNPEAVAEIARSIGEEGATDAGPRTRSRSVLLLLGAFVLLWGEGFLVRSG